MFNVVIEPRTTTFKMFSQCLLEAKKANKHGHFVSYFRPEQLDALKCKIFLTVDGLAGFAVTGSNELIAVFKHPQSTQSNVLAKVLPLAKLYGARRLECFEGYLSKAYSNHGFRVLESHKWDDSQAASDWPKTAGTPNYLVMGV